MRAARRTSAATTYLGRGRCLLFGQAQLSRLGRRLPARAHPELGQDRRDVMGDGLRRDVQPLGDLGVGQAVAEQREDLDLARGELTGVRRIVERRGPRAMLRTPRRRRRRAIRRAAGTAPSRWKSANARSSSASRSLSARASAASYGQPSSSHARAAAAQSPRSSVANGSPIAVGSTWSARPARRRHAHSSPTAHGSSNSSASASASSVSPATAAASPSSQSSLGAGRRHRGEPLELLGATGQRERLVEQRPRVRIAPPGAQPAEHRPAARSGSATATFGPRSTALRALGGLVPPPLVEAQLGQPAGHVQPPRRRDRAPRSTRSRPTGSGRRRRSGAGARPPRRDWCRRERRAPRDRSSSASARLRSSLSTPSGQLRGPAPAPTLLSACTRISVSSSRSASSMARDPAATAPADVVGQHAQLGLVRVGHRELASGRLGLEQLDRLAGLPPRPWRDRRRTRPAARATGASRPRGRGRPAPGAGASASRRAVDASATCWVR